MDLVERLSDEGARKILRRAELVDNIDRIIGPLASTLQLSGDPLLGVAANVLGFIEIGVLKLPFVITYLKETKDYDALVQWIPKEIFSNGVPYGDVIDVLNSYKNRARHHYEQQLIRKVEPKIKEEKRSYLSDSLS